jgi:hypothetical protein
VAVRRQRGGGNTPQYGAHASDKLAGAEGLHDVVISADFQPHHTIHLAGACGEKENRQGLCFADRFADLEPCHVRQSDIEDDETEGLRLHLLHRFVTGGDGHHRESVGLEGIDHVFTDGGFVFDNENFGSHVWSGEFLNR